jgi:hypothetical protein
MEKIISLLTGSSWNLNVILYFLSLISLSHEVILFEIFILTDFDLVGDILQLYNP